MKRRSHSCSPGWAEREKFCYRINPSFREPDLWVTHARVLLIGWCNPRGFHLPLRARLLMHSKLDVAVVLTWTNWQNYNRNNSAPGFCSGARAWRRFPRGRCCTRRLLEPLLPSLPGKDQRRQFSNCVALILSQLSSGSWHHPSVSSTRPMAAESGVGPVLLRLSDLG